ncbi:MAG: helix-turn-helix domain-containing protein [Parvibaculum sp.]|nr:helix-turn-helix domain-containing protein [Parvibaculum sp.]
MSGVRSKGDQAETAADTGGDRRLRADAKRSIDALMQAAREVFASSGVDATVREIAERAGVGMGTLYRHFPQRADLITAVLHSEMDACSDAAATLAAKHPPFEALAAWMQRYADLVGTKRGLAKALNSGDPVFEGLLTRFEERLRPAVRPLFAAAIVAGEIEPDTDADEILCAVSSLCMSAYDAKPEHARRMVALFIDGLRRPVKGSSSH